MAISTAKMSGSTAQSAWRRVEHFKLMAKPESWRLIPASYPLSKTFQTRFQDMDVNGHLNNVSFAALFESARVTVNQAARNWNDHPTKIRPLIAAVTINYLREGSYPEDVLIGSGIGHIGTSSWTISQAMFQHGNCIASADSVIVFRDKDGSAPVPADLRVELEALLLTPDAV
jgi:acyl-CoA thioester hydrolase